MFDAEKMVEAPADYAFQVRLILATRNAVLGRSEQHILVDAFATGRSAIECAAGLLSGYFGGVKTLEALCAGETAVFL